jgi:type I restriction enzyme S subunit
MSSEYAATPLGKIAHIEMGQSPDSSTVLEGEAVGVPFLQGNAEFGSLHPSPRFTCVAPMKMCNAGDILISVRAPVGAINIADRDYCIGRGLAAVRIDGMTSRLAAHVISAAAPALRRVAQGTTFEAINKADLSSLQVLAPTSEDRDSLSQFLDTLDTTIRQTEAIIAKLKQVKQGLLHDLLTRGIDANGELRPPQSEAPHLYKASPLGWIPMEWTAIKLRELASLQRGHDIVASAFVSGHYPVISSSGTIGHHNVATAVGPNIVVGRKGSIGSVHYVETDFWAHDTSLFVTNFFGNHVKFVGLLFAYLDLARYGTKSGSPSLNRNDLHPLDIARPALEEQLRIVDVLTAHTVLLERHEQELLKLSSLKSGLMDDLLTGRVRVTPLLKQEVTT